jgi:hypothetical protein
MHRLSFAVFCALVACVGDSSPPVDAGSDATTADVGVDAPSDASTTCVPIPSTPGPGCFGTRCTPETQACCVGLSGGGLIGQCEDAGACGAQPYQESWDCDKTFDCPAQAPKCCASAQAGATLFGGLNEGGCPLQLHVTPNFDAGSDAGPPPPFSIATCETSCSGFQLCATDNECTGGLKCFPAEFTQTSGSKTFGVCVP